MNNVHSNRIQQDALQYILDLQPGLAQVIGDSDGNRYVHSPRGIHAVSDGSAWTYPLTDALGSVRGYTDAHSNVFSNVNYTPIGVPDENIAGPAFTGEWRSSNGTQYHRARHLSPGLGGWLSLDPWEGVPLNAMSLNRYGYVWGNPVNRADASGLCPQMTIEQTRTAVRTLQAINPSFMSVDGATVDVVANIVCAVQTAGQYAPQIVTIGGTSVSVGVTIAGTGAAATAGVVMGVASLGLLLGVGIYLGIWHAPPVPYTPDQLDDMRPPMPTPSPTGTPAPYVQPRPDPALQPQPTPAPTPGDVRIDPRPNDPCRDDDKVCDPVTFAQWWLAQPNHNGPISDPAAEAWENSIARNTPDTFPGQFPKRLDISGATAIGLRYNTLDADGATERTCRLVDAKYATSSFLNPSRTFLLTLEALEELRRYRYALTITPAVGLEIRINRKDNEAYWIAALGVSGFTYGTDGFVNVYDSANYPP